MTLTPFLSLAFVNPEMLGALAVVIAILFFFPGLLGPLGRLLGLTLGFSIRKHRVLSDNANNSKRQVRRTTENSRLQTNEPKDRGAIPGKSDASSQGSSQVWAVVMLAVGVVTMLLWYLMHSN